MYAVPWRRSPKCLSLLRCCVVSMSRRAFVSRRASNVRCCGAVSARSQVVESRESRGVGSKFDHDDEDDQIVFFRPGESWLRFGGLRRNGLMQSVRERPSDPWIGMIGWVGTECWIRSVDCGLWMAGGRSRLLGAAVIVGLERVKPAVVVSQRAFPSFYSSLDNRSSGCCSVALSNERGLSSGRGRR